MASCNKLFVPGTKTAVVVVVVVTVMVSLRNRKVVGRLVSMTSKNMVAESSGEE